jgi:hypothetical protein
MRKTLIITNRQQYYKNFVLGKPAKEGEFYILNEAELSESSFDQEIVRVIIDGMIEPVRRAKIWTIILAAKPEIPVSVTLVLPIKERYLPFEKSSVIESVTA